MEYNTFDDIIKVLKSDNNEQSQQAQAKPQEQSQTIVADNEQKWFDNNEEKSQDNEQANQSGVNATNSENAESTNAVQPVVNDGQQDLYGALNDRQSFAQYVGDNAKRITMYDDAENNPYSQYTDEELEKDSNMVRFLASTAQPGTPARNRVDRYIEEVNKRNNTKQLAPATKNEDDYYLYNPSSADEEENEFLNLNDEQLQKQAEETKKSLDAMSADSKDYADTYKRFEKILYAIDMRDYSNKNNEPMKRYNQQVNAYNDAIANQRAKQNSEANTAAKGLQNWLNSHDVSNDINAEAYASTSWRNGAIDTANMSEQEAIVQAWKYVNGDTATADKINYVRGVMSNLESRKKGDKNAQTLVAKMLNEQQDTLQEYRKIRGSEKTASGKNKYIDDAEKQALLTFKQNAEAEEKANEAQAQSEYDASFGNVSYFDDGNEFARMKYASQVLTGVDYAKLAVNAWESIPENKRNAMILTIAEDRGDLTEQGINKVADEVSSKFMQDCFNAIKADIPDAMVGTIQNALSNSIVGTLTQGVLRSMNPNAGEVTYQSLIAEKQADWASKNTFGMISSTALQMVLDAPVFNVLGKGANIATKTMAKPILNRAVAGRWILPKQFTNSIYNTFSMTKSGQLALGVTQGAFLGAMFSPMQLATQSFATGQTFGIGDYLSNSATGALHFGAMGVTPFISNGMSKWWGNKFSGTGKVSTIFNSVGQVAIHDLISPGINATLVTAIENLGDIYSKGISPDLISEWARTYGEFLGFHIGGKVTHITRGNLVKNLRAMYGHQTQLSRSVFTDTELKALRGSDAIKEIQRIIRENEQLDDATMNKIAGQHKLIIEDASIPEAVKMKLFAAIGNSAIATPTIADCRIEKDGKNSIVSIYTADGKLFSQERYKSEKAAQNEKKRIDGYIKVNNINMLEGAYNQVWYSAINSDAIESMARETGNDANTIVERLDTITRKKQNGERLSEDDNAFVKSFGEFFKDAQKRNENAETDRILNASDVKDAFKKLGRDVDAILSKMPWQWSEAEAEVIDRYTRRMQSDVDRFNSEIKSNNEKQEIANELDGISEQSYNTTDSESMNALAIELNIATAEAEKEFGGATLQEIFDNPVEAIQRINNSKDYTDGQKAKLNELCRLQVRMNAMVRRVNDDINNELEQSRQAIEQLTNKQTDEVIEVELTPKAGVKEGTKVYVINGQLSTYGEGVVDYDKSDKSIAIYIEGEGKKMVSQSQIVRVISRQSVDEALNAQAQEIVSRHSAEADAKFNATIPAQVGYKFPVLLGGEERELEIVEQRDKNGNPIQAKEGNVFVNDNGNVVEMPIDALTNMANELKARRIAEERAKRYPAQEVKEAEKTDTAVKESEPEPKEQEPSPKEMEIEHKENAPEKKEEAPKPEPKEQESKPEPKVNEPEEKEEISSQKYERGEVVLNIDGEDKIGYINGKKGELYEYYVQGEDNFRYATEKELDSIVKEYTPDKREDVLDKDIIDSLEQLAEQKENDSIEERAETPKDESEKYQLADEQGKDIHPMSKEQESDAINPDIEEKQRVQELTEEEKTSMKAIADHLGVDLIFEDNAPYNGVYRTIDEETKKPTIRISRRATNPLDAVFGHEILHRLRKVSSDAYNEMLTAVRVIMGDDAFYNEAYSLKRLYAENKENPVAISDKAAGEEVVANFVGSLIHDKAHLSKLVYKLSHPVLSSIRDAFSEFLNYFRRGGLTYDAAMAKGALRIIDRAFANKEYTDMMKAADLEAQSDSKYNNATEADVARIIRQDLAEKWEKYEKESKKKGKNKKNVTPHAITLEQVDGIIEQTQQLFKAIDNSLNGEPIWKDWQGTLPTIVKDWRDGEEHQIVTWARNNVEYKYDVSADLLCVNNEGLESFLSSPDVVRLMGVIHKSNKDGFESDDYMRAYEVMRDMGVNVPCKGCFDAAARFKMLPSVAIKFVKLVNKEIAERNKNPEKYDEKIKQQESKGRTADGMPVTGKTKLLAIKAAVAGDKLTEPMTFQTLMSAKGQVKTLIENGGIFRAWQKTGAGRPKDKLLPEPYTGVMTQQALTIIAPYGEKTPAFDKEAVNTGTGLRRNSHSEFRPLLAVDEIQFMRDCFIKELMVFKYMKELDDARLFGNLGVKMNMSFFPTWDRKAKACGLDDNGDYLPSEESVGSREFIYYDADGKMHFDGHKGFEEAKKLVNKDVSLSSVVMSIPHLLKCLTDVPTPKYPKGVWGSLIPFHASGATAAMLFKQGLGFARAMKNFAEAYTDYDKGVTNFEAVQNDRFGEGWVIVEGNKKGTKVEKGHKLEFVNGTHYYHKESGLHLFSSWYCWDRELKEGDFEKLMRPNPKQKKTEEQKAREEELKKQGIKIEAEKDYKKIIREYCGHDYDVDYNNKVRELSSTSETCYVDAARYYVEELRKLHLIPRFDFDVPEDIFLKMCEDAGVDPRHEKLGWKGEGNSWSPVDSDAYYSLWCDYGMTDPATGKYSPHMPVGYINEKGEREFRMPDNTVDIVSKSFNRYVALRKKEESMHEGVLREYVARSVKAKRITQEQADEFLNTLGQEDAKYSLRIEDRKKEQFEIINESNRMRNDSRAGILNADNILSFREAIDIAKADNNGKISSYPDVPNSVFDKAMRSGFITVYGSEPIENGVFVTPSMIGARMDSDDGKVFSKVVSINDVAWLNSDEGQFADIATKFATNVAKNKFPFEIEEGTKYSLIVDQKEIDRLNKEEVEIGYQNIELKDDLSVGSPMASRLKNKGKGKIATGDSQFGRWGVSEENPDLVDENGKIDLVKPDGKTVGNVDYNPYFHIRPYLFNKQFKQAWERPKLVFIETEFPASELSSGFKANKAKLSVGRHNWNGGDLILSRWTRPKAIVPWRDVAPHWIEEFKDSGVYFDIVPPALLNTMRDNGVKILPPHKGMGKNCFDAYEEFKKGNYNPEFITDEQIDAFNENIRAKRAESEDDAKYQITGKSNSADKSLIGVHNISEDKLIKAIKQGGFANPSLAVIDTKNGMHSDYGKISLIPKSSLIDSKTGNNAGTFAGDAWTPTYPHVEKQMSDNGWSMFYRDIHKVSNNDSINNELSSVWRNYMDGGDPDKLSYWFLKERGIEPENVYINSGYTEEQRNKFAKITDNGSKRFEDLSEEQRNGIISLMAEKDGVSIEEKLEKYQHVMEVNKRVLEKDKVSPIRKASLQRQINDIEQYGVTITDADYLMNLMKRALDTHGKLDVDNTLKSSHDKVVSEGFQEEFDKWLIEKEEKYGVKELLFDGFDLDGNRKYIPHTLENASKMMNRESETNSYGATGFSPTRAVLLKKMRTLEEIRKNKDKLKEVDEETKQQYDDAQSEMSSIVSALSDMQKITDNPFFNIDYANQRLQEAITKKDPIEWLNKEYGYDIDKNGDFAKGLTNLIDNLENLPVKYFETKFNRPVTLGEFAIAIVPDGTSKYVVDALKKSGIDVRMYDGTEEGRASETMNAILDRDDIRFQLRGTPEQKFSDTDSQSKSREAESMSRRMNVPVRVVDDTEYIFHDNRAEENRRKNSKGYYDSLTGEVVVVAPNNETAGDVINTVFHETVAHKGLRDIAGEDYHERFIGMAYGSMSDAMRSRINSNAYDAIMDGKYDDWAEAKNSEVSKVLNDLSQKDFAEFTEDEIALWKRLREHTMNVIEESSGIADIRDYASLNDTELRYMLWKDNNNVNSSVERDAIDTAMRIEYGLDNDTRYSLNLKPTYKSNRDAVSAIRDEQLPLEDRIAIVSMKLAGKQKQSKRIRNDAVKKVAESLDSINSAISAQRLHDKLTANRIVALIKEMIAGNFLSNIGKKELKELFGAVPAAIGERKIESKLEPVFDVLIKNMDKDNEDLFNSLISTKAKKVDKRGVEVQGTLDAEGQQMLQALNIAKEQSQDKIEQMITEAQNYISEEENEVLKKDESNKLSGYLLALQYAGDIAPTYAEEEDLKTQIKILSQETGDAKKNSKAAIKAIKGAIRKLKIQRIEAYRNIIGQLSKEFGESVGRAKEFKDMEKQRVQEIHHNANSDMQGRSHASWVEQNDTAVAKVVNNSAFRILFSPLSSFDQMMRMFGRKSANGEGYLWNRYVRGWVECREKELTGFKEKMKILDEKVKELFPGRKGPNSITDMIKWSENLPKSTVEYWNGERFETRELSQGNLMYIYMASKMIDGKMKLAKMGITDEDVARIKQSLDPKIIQMADWIQEELLPKARVEYNETHKRLFGAPMASIENYFPLKILKTALEQKEEDLDVDNTGAIRETTNAFKRRTVNVKPLDIVGTNALNLVVSHLSEMEHINAFGEWNRDLNTLRTYNRFRNQVMNMKSVYGSGEVLWREFNKLCQIAAGTYKPQSAIGGTDSYAVNIAKGYTASRIAFRAFTAAKQLASIIAYLPDVSVSAIAKSAAKAYSSFQWSMDNLPLFKERWQTRIAGDPRLLKTEKDWSVWSSKAMELSSKYGMLPNAFVDAVTVAIGAKAIYDTRYKKYYKQYKKSGATDDDAKAMADNKAKQDATIMYNSTQQSNEAIFLSPIQVDRTWHSVMMSIFRNSPFSYTRQTYDAIRNLKRSIFDRGYRKESIEFMTKQLMREQGLELSGVTEEQRNIFRDIAKKNYDSEIRRGLLRVATFGFACSFLWELYSKLPQLTISDDDEQNKEIFRYATTKALFSFNDGLYGGDVQSTALQAFFFGGGTDDALSTIKNSFNKSMPFTQSITDIAKKLCGERQAEGLSDLISLAVATGTGVDVKTIGDMVYAVMDACGDDIELSKEAMIFIMRVTNTPQSQIDQVFFEEVGMTGKEASKLTPEQLAKRYAEYKVKRGTMLIPSGFVSQKLYDSREQYAYQQIKERYSKRENPDIVEKYMELDKRIDEIGKQKTDAVNAVSEGKFEDGIEKLSEFANSRDYQMYEEFGQFRREFNKLVNFYMKSKSPKEAEYILNAIAGIRKDIATAYNMHNQGNEEMKYNYLQDAKDKFMDFYDEYAQMRPDIVEKSERANAARNALR